jgi:hypothetical protein
MFRIFFAVLIIAFLANPSFSQNNANKISSFTSRLNKPIDVDIEENSAGATIILTNQSFYRYIVTIELKNVINLRAFTGMKQVFIVQNGTKRVKSFAIANKELPVDLTCTIQYQVAPSNYEKGDYTYIYPIGSQKNFNDFLYIQDETLYRNMYQLKKGDTVFCMRKGILTNIIHNEGLADRIGPAGSVEILHEDGTVMVYTGISRNPDNIKRGNLIYPGQPIGIMDEEQNVLSTFLFFIQPDASVSSMNIKFPFDCFVSLENSRSSNCIVNYPPDLIQMEMSNAEKKKYTAGKLY